MSAPSAPAEFVSYRAFAKLCDVSEKTIRNRVKSGALPRLDGCVLPAALAASPQNARGGQPAEPADGSGPSLAEEQRKKEIALARLRRQQFQRRASAWVDRDMAADGWNEIVADVRARLSQIAAAAAPLVVSKRPAEIQAALANVINQALADLSSPGDRAADEPPPRDEPVGDDWPKIDAERAKVSAIRASHELTLAIQSGSVASIEALTAAMGQHLANLRTGLLSLPATLPPRLFLRADATAEGIIAAAVAELIADLPGAAALLRSVR